jgi:hypothetical protein
MMHPPSRFVSAFGREPAKAEIANAFFAFISLLVCPDLSAND